MTASIKYLFLFVFLFLFSVGFTQEQLDVRLLEKYSKNELIALQKNNPEEYFILVKALDVGITISEIQEGEGKNYIFDGVLDIDPNIKHTFISLGIELKEDRNQYFKFKGTNKIAIVPSKIALLYSE